MYVYERAQYVYIYKFSHAYTHRRAFISGQDIHRARLAAPCFLQLLSQRRLQLDQLVSRGCAAHGPTTAWAVAWR